MAPEMRHPASPTKSGRVADDEYVIVKNGDGTVEEGNDPGRFQILVADALK